MRSSSRSMLTRPSARASGAPGQVWMPCPNARCWRALARSTSNSSGSRSGAGRGWRRRSAPSPWCPAGMSTPPTVVGTRRQPEVALDRALEAQRLLDEVRDAVAVVAEQLLELRVARRSAGARSRAGARWSPGRRRTGWRRCRTTSITSGIEPSGNVAVARPVSTSSARLAPPVLDVRGEPLVEELERAVRHRVAVGAPDSAAAAPSARCGTSRGPPRARRAGRRSRASRTASRTRG